MPPVTASAPSNDLHAAYLDNLERTGRGNQAYYWAARVFFGRWPDPQRWAAEPLEARLSAGTSTRPVITFLMLHRVLRPGYDYLLERKLSSIWREIRDSPLGPDLDAFMAAAADLGFTERVRFAAGSQVPARLLIQTGRRLGQLTLADLAASPGLPGPARTHRQGPPPLPRRGQQRPAGLVPPRDRRRAAPLRRAGPVHRTAGRGPAAGPRHDDRLPGTQTCDLPAQDGVGDRDQAQALRRVPRPGRPRPGLRRLPGPAQAHRALPDIAGRARSAPRTTS